MKLLKLSIFLIAASLISAIASAQNLLVVILAGTLLDGKGRALHNVLIVVQAARS